ncbi:unnamed protein product [Ectocarpus sp. CCAP 1310/34]|nr:unnamed protein product [Ectocarpus sp. CCAP 1310/34]
MFRTHAVVVRPLTSHRYKAVRERHGSGGRSIREAVGVSEFGWHWAVVHCCCC